LICGRGGPTDQINGFLELLDRALAHCAHGAAIAIRAEQRILGFRWSIVARRHCISTSTNHLALESSSYCASTLANPRLARPARKVDLDLAVGDVDTVNRTGADGAEQVARVDAHTVFVIGGAFGFGGAAEAGELLEGGELFGVV
jgi:hypothetical protein